MKAGRIWGIFLLIIILQTAWSWWEEGGDLEERRPPVAVEAETGPLLPPPSSRDPVVTVEEGPLTNSVGSAVAVTDNGVWVTARHVVDGCDRVGIVIGNKRAQIADRIKIHPKSDLAIVWTRLSPPAMSLSREPLHVNQAGFHFGFPAGQPGQATSVLLGRETIRSVGRHRGREPAVAWAEVARYPETDRLGGISGGPAVNRAGEVVGITVAASVRRGRIITTDPASLDELLKAVDVHPNGHPSPQLSAAGPTTQNYIEYGTALRRQLTVAQVICRVFQNK
jgi:serine protease Do